MIGHQVPALGNTGVSLRILLAEDETLIAMTLLDALETEGYTVTVAGDGAAALAEARAACKVMDLVNTSAEDMGPAALEAEAEALAKANDSTYGLGSAIFTKDMVRAHTLARKIEAGMVWINSSQDCHFRVPFGGVKQSGIGRELGEAGLDAYTNKKAVHVNLGTYL